MLLSRGVSGDGGLPRRLGGRDGNRSDSTESPGAVEAWLARGLEGGRGIGADRKAYRRRTVGVCWARGLGLVPLVPRPCTVRQALAAWGPQQPPLPLLVEQPGRTTAEAPRRWQGKSVMRPGEVAYSDGHVAAAVLRVVVISSSQLAQPQTQSYTAAPGKEAAAVADHGRPVEGRRFACRADADAALADYEGRGQGRRGRRPRAWRYHTVR